MLLAQPVRIIHFDTKYFNKSITIQMIYKKLLIRSKNENVTCMGISLILCVSFIGQAKAEQLAYSVKDGKFVTAEGEIPSGCLGQLKSTLMGMIQLQQYILIEPFFEAALMQIIPTPAVKKQKFLTQ